MCLFCILWEYTAYDLSFSEMYWQTVRAYLYSVFDAGMLATFGYFSRLSGDVICHAFLYEARDCRKLFIYILFLLLFLLNVPGAALLKDYLL